LAAGKPARLRLRAAKRRFSKSVRPCLPRLSSSPRQPRQSVRRLRHNGPARPRSRRINCCSEASAISRCSGLRRSARAGPACTTMRTTPRASPSGKRRRHGISARSRFFPLAMRSGFKRRRCLRRRVSPVRFRRNSKSAPSTIRWNMKRTASRTRCCGCPRRKSPPPRRCRSAANARNARKKRSFKRRRPGRRSSAAKCAKCEEEEKLQKRAAGPQAAGGEAPALVHEVLRSPGQPLDAETRGFFEPRFGHDFSRVRVHTGTSAEQSTREVNAQAYTVGRSMVFDAGRFAPGTQEGRRLIAHELTHVLQQSGSDGIRSSRSSEASGPFPAASGATIQRQAKKPAPDGAGSGKKAAKSTPATAPKLTLTPSKNGPPCACLVVVHNDERNARKTAGLMHDNCFYNLPWLSPIAAAA
jgi:hypothetical protein